jgi:hypothetical protein
MHSIDYAQYLYDSAKIKTNDVPLLTDQYAPVENLTLSLVNQML